MLRVLFVEDEPQAVESVIAALGADFKCEVHPFGKAENALNDFVPDIVVLDILDGGSTGEAEPTGVATYGTIWDCRFCPLVVYSAHPEILSEEHDEHPFVRFVQKGMGSIDKIKKNIDDLRPHAESIREAEMRVRGEFSCALRDVAPDVFRAFTDENERKKVILRSAQRRLAALMDDLSRHGEKLQAWEQYVCPPFGTDLLLGDVIREKKLKSDDPSSFYLVLTPSCDLANSHGRTAKVADVLVASCCKVSEGIGATSLRDMTSSKLGGRLTPGMLSQGFLDGVIPLPTLEKRVPVMMANLKRLKLIPISHITSEAAEYERVASIDSPFRELVSWAYLQTSCRPGLPDRDFNLWRDEIVAAYKTERGELT